MEQSNTQVYNGTVMQNFLIGARECNGRILFVKNRLRGVTGAQFPRALFYTRNLEEAIIHATSTARDLGDKPIVLCGMTEHSPYIPGNEPFEVRKVYVLKNEYTNMDIILDCLDSEERRSGLVKLEDYFTEENPKVILGKLKM